MGENVGMAAKFTVTCAHAQEKHMRAHTHAHTSGHGASAAVLAFRPNAIELHSSQKF